MKEAFDKKVEFYEDRINNNYEQNIGIDFSTPIFRSPSVMTSMEHWVKIFLLDYETRKRKRSTAINDLVKAYFTTEPTVFELTLAEDISKASQEKTTIELRDYTNEIANAIAYEKCKLKAVRAWIESTPNSHS